MSKPPGFDPKMLEVLVCPLTQGPLEINSTRTELISRRARLAYPIREGVPIMLDREARPLTDTEYKQRK